MEFTYIASPYTHLDPEVRKLRYELVLEYTQKLVEQGHVCFSPIVYGHLLVVNTNLPFDFEYWKAFNDTIIGVSTRMIVLTIDGWEESAGIAYEISLAQSLGIPIEYVSGFEL